MATGFAGFLLSKTDSRLLAVLQPRSAALRVAEYLGNISASYCFY
jgi:hypothetical protein